MNNRIKQDEQIERGLYLFVRFIFSILKESSKDINKLVDLSQKSVRNLAIALIITGSCLAGITLTDYKTQIIMSLIGFVFFLGVKNIILIKYDKYKEAKNIISLNKQFDDRFEAIGFKDNMGKYPLLVKENETENFKNYLFYSCIPVSKWEAKKSDIEEILNKRIVSIKTDHNDTTIKKIQITKLPEPKFVKFDKKYFSQLPWEIWLGLNVYSEPVYIDLKQLPNLIFAGAAGGGKSTAAYNIYTQLRRHKENKIILCDFKTTFKSLVKYNNNKPTLKTKEEFIEMLEWAKKENKRRIDLFNQYDECEDIYEYNKLVGDSDQLKFIHIMIDELAIIVSHDKKDSDTYFIENTITHMAQTARSQGFQLWIFTQRPSAKTVPAEARANFNTRVSVYQPDKNTSEMAVGDDSASKLPNIKGRAVVKLANNHIETQLAYLAKEEISKYLNTKEEMYVE